MGQFNDYNNTHRDSWRFCYTGRQLLPFAVKKLAYFKEKEERARAEIAQMLVDASIKASDPKIDELKRSIESFSKEKEKCAIWVHEFSREATKDYYLLLGDVSYFDIITEWVSQ
jgi:hypothetical protein